MPSTNEPADDRDVYALVAIAVVAVLTLLYSVLIAQQILLWFVIAANLLVVYLVWRFVRAHERIAAALEARNAPGEDDGGEADDDGDDPTA